jgi:hypothetical protein
MLVGYHCSTPIQVECLEKNPKDEDVALNASSSETCRIITIVFCLVKSLNPIETVSDNRLDWTQLPSNNSPKVAIWRQAFLAALAVFR